MSVDGTDFRIQNPTQFWKGWYSFKFKGPGVRYEVALSIQSADIVWVNGPFPAGAWPDINIFRGWLHDLGPANAGRLKTSRVWGGTHQRVQNQKSVQLGLNHI